MSLSDGLKLEDIVAIHKAMEDLGVAGSDLTERHRKLLIAGRNAIGDLLWERDLLLADVAARQEGSAGDDGAAMRHTLSVHETDKSDRTEGVAALQQAGEPVAWAPHHHKRHPWAQPGDEPNRIWIMRFADPDMREMVWTDENAEADAKAAYEKYSPAWNVYLFAAVPTSSAIRQQVGGGEDRAEIAAFLVEQYDEPLAGDLGARLNYWRDKCITAGQRLDPKRWGPK